MKSPVLRLAVAALLLSGLPATAAADGYWYLGVGAGLSWAQFYSADFNPGSCTTCTTSERKYDAGFKGFLGYQISRFWGFEASVINVGKFEYRINNGSVTQEAIYEVTGLGFTFMPTIPLGRKLSLYGRFGGFSSTARLTRHGDQFVPNAPSEGTQYRRYSPLLGFGAQYYFDEEFGLRLEYENYGQVGNACSTTGPDCTGRANMKMGSVNLVFAF